MTRGVKVRLALFVALAAVGIVYITGTYLGLVDRVLGRGLTISATLPDSGGLFVGSEVTYRGVKIGKVASMEVTREGLEAELALEEGTRIPLDARVEVHNLSAVGEQYLDIVPEDGRGPYAEDGDVLVGDDASLPIGEDELLVDLDALVASVDKGNLSTVIEELGLAFQDTAGPLEEMVDSGSRFVEAALANEEATFRLLDNGRTVLQTQQRHREDIRTFARSLADLTGTLRGKDPELRTVLEGGASAVREVERLMAGLEPTMPVFIGNLVTLNQIVTTRLPAVEQLLVTFPKIVANGFTGTPGDGYGHINLQLAQNPGPCREGFMPSDQWRPASDLADNETYPATCRSGAPYNQRGPKYAPRFGGSTSRVAPGATLADEPAVTVGSRGGLQEVFGDDAWRWMLIGPQEGM
ncbi:MlaD family protein [Nocardioides marmotae]|uniref:MCE family protein n=1 Tax=Nocardioides marmotae TaxID=2663857 RepID=A0A6I3JAK9_9ACTN|nr:MlaD family protein [Nocardioides marmotae]MCR6031146.1 MCE family protein [Gordonia jinghuaiqii]MBC9731864.1 MCE family protein [Nocardioides marmotae]MTB82983.1 MCE family protein [Nocardioides marmotae]MTB94785.1 MCE family protein [Nocardioides marmotae]QKE01222.1 MCE family protein [Nocardioides marmotae]